MGQVVRERKMIEALFPYDTRQKIPFCEVCPTSGITVYNFCGCVQQPEAMLEASLRTSEQGPEPLRYAARQCQAPSRLSPVMHVATSPSSWP